MPRLFQNSVLNTAVIYRTKTVANKRIRWGAEWHGRTLKI